VTKFTVLLSVLLFAVQLAWAEDDATNTDKPSISTSQIVQLTADVEAINHDTREVTLRGPQGNSVSFIASEQARNLDQVKVGDTLNVKYTQNLSIQVVAADGAEAGAGELSAAARSDKGEMPALSTINAVVVTATVEDINLENNTFKLKGPKGEVREYVARDPENLKKAVVGDLVVITYKEGISLSLERNTGE